MIVLSFHQAVITVNLTSMLVLTTMFINVSNNLPKTSYMKMIDVWLLFNLLVPFIVVLIHTYMDTLRSDEEKTDDNTRKVISNITQSLLHMVSSFSSWFPFYFQVAPALVSVNEQEELAAQKQFYDNLRQQRGKTRVERLALMRKVSVVYNPLVALTFVAVYWLAGLRHAEII